MESPQISVIVAVYKAEAYIRRCVDSLLAQTFRDFEILLVDDGSPDKSGEICDEYAAKDAHIRVFHKENDGVSSARHCGMNHVRGKYVIHVDPDDWVDPDMLEGLYDQAEESGADMVICDILEEYSTYTKYRCQRPKALAVKQVLIEVSSGRLLTTLANKLVKTECYLANHIQFPISIRRGEDDYVVICLLNRVNTILYLHRAYYHVDKYINPNSLSKNYTKDIFYDYQMLMDRIKMDAYGGKSTPAYNSYVCYIAYDTFIHNVLSTKEYMQAFRRDFRAILQSCANLKMKMFVLLSLMGFKGIAYPIYCVLKRIRDMFLL